MGGIIFRQNTPKAVKRFAAMGLDTDKYIGQFGQKGFMLDCELGNISAPEFCSEFAKACGKSFISHEQALECWLEFIDDVPVERLDALQRLHKDYSLGLASNTNPFVLEYMDSPKISVRGKPLSKYFDNMFCSCYIHLYKPSVDFFNYIINEGGLKAEQTLFIDDSKANLEGAAKVGIHTLHIPSNENWIPILSDWLKTHNLPDPLA